MFIRKSLHYAMFYEWLSQISHSELWFRKKIYFSIFCWNVSRREKVSTLEYFKMKDLLSYKLLLPESMDSRR